MKWLTERRNKKLREAELTNRVRASQQALLEAATTTADTASEVTLRLKNRLDDSIRQFELAASILSDGLIVCDQHGNVQSFNPSAEKLFGYSPEEALHIGVHRLFKTLDGAIDGPEALFDLIRTDADVVGLTREGAPFSTDLSIAHLDRTDRTAISIILVRNFACAPLHDEAIQFRSIFENGCDGILVVKNDLITAANPAAATLFGYAQDKLLNMPLGLVVSPTGNPGSEATQVEVMATRPGGQEIAMMIQTAPITWENGAARLVAVKAIAKGVVRPPEGDMFCFGTDWRLASARRTTTDMIFCMDSTFGITFANRAFRKSFGIDASPVGQNLHDILDEGKMAPLALHLLGLDAKTPTRRMQLQVGDGADARFQVWRYHADYGDDGVLHEYQCVGRDITEGLRAILDQ